MSDPFEHRRPTDGQYLRLTKVREACRELENVIREEVPNSRGRSLAITKLEEVSMWANKAICFEEKGDSIE